MVPKCTAGWILNLKYSTFRSSYRLIELDRIYICTSMVCVLINAGIKNQIYYHKVGNNLCIQQIVIHLKSISTASIAHPINSIQIYPWSSAMKLSSALLTRCRCKAARPDVHGLFASMRELWVGSNVSCTPQYYSYSWHRCLVRHCLGPISVTQWQFAASGDVLN